MQAPPSINLPSIDSKLSKTPSSGSPSSAKKVTPIGSVQSSTYRLPQSMEHLANDSFTGKQLLLQQSSIKSLPSSSYIRELFVQKYALGRILGRGASAEVFEARLKNASDGDHYPFAVKIIRRDNRMNDNTTMATELEILRRVNHAHVIRLVEVFETRDSLFLVMERAQGGDLISALANLPVYTEGAVREVFRQLLEAVEYLHSLGIVHRDLKLDNLLYDTIPSCTSSSNDETDDESTVDTNRSSTTNAAAISVKVADFGLSALLPTDKESQRNWFNFSSSPEKRDKRLTEMWGTTEYFAPEVYERHYGRQADVWALGCILFEMLTGEIAFPYKETPVGFVERLLFHGGSKPQRVFERKAGWKKLSPEAQSLIKKMLKSSPVKRLSVSECLRHPFFTNHDSEHGLKHVDSVASVQTSFSESILSEEDHSDTVVLAEAQRVLKDRTLRRQRRYAHLLAEVAARHNTKH